MPMLGQTMTEAGLYTVGVCVCVVSEHPALGGHGGLGCGWAPLGVQPASTTAAASATASTTGNTTVFEILPECLTYRRQEQPASPDTLDGFDAESPAGFVTGGVRAYTYDGAYSQLTGSASLALR